jgi:hypothetical protein
VEDIRDENTTPHTLPRVQNKTTVPEQLSVQQLQHEIILVYPEN